MNEYRVKAAEVNARIEKLKAEVKNCEEKRQTAEDDRNNFRLEKSELKLKAETFKVSVFLFYAQLLFLLLSCHDCIWCSNFVSLVRLLPAV